MANNPQPLIQTFTGRLVNPLNLSVDDIDILDIAHSLAHQCRWGGHCRSHFSVAQHSVYVSRRVPSEDALWGLLHDASEAYLIDLPRPLKHHPEFGQVYQAAEAKVMATVAEKFGLVFPRPSSVKVVDDRMLATEYRDLMGGGEHPDGRDLGEPYSDVLYGWLSSHAEQEFLDQFEKVKVR